MKNKLVYVYVMDFSTGEIFETVMNNDDDVLSRLQELGFKESNISYMVTNNSLIIKPIE